MTTQPPAAKRDELHSLLASEERRRLIRYLDRSGETDFEELRDYLEAADGPPDDPSRVAVALVHNHLPMLEEANVIEYDHDDKQVRLNGVSDPVQDYLEGNRGSRHPAE